MKYINFFETVKATLNCDVKTTCEFIPVDRYLFLRSGLFAESNGDKYEICTVLKGSPVFVFKAPNGKVSMTDSANSNKCHEELSESDFTLPEDVKFVNTKNAVLGKLGLFN